MVVALKKAMLKEISERYNEMFLHPDGPRAKLLKVKWLLDHKYVAFDEINKNHNEILNYFDIIDMKTFTKIVDYI